MATFTHSERSDIARALAARAGTEGDTGPGVDTGPGTAANKLPAPTGLSVSSVTRTTANLAWTAVAGAGSYTVQRKLDGTNRDWSTLSAVTPASLRAAGLTAGNAYLFRVRANHPTDSSRNSDYSSPVSAITPAPVGDTRLATPTGLATSTITSNSAGVSWGASTGAVGYELRWRGASQDSHQSSGRLGTGLSANIGDLTASTRYAVSVRALATSAANNSLWSGDVSFTTAALAPRVPVNRIPTPSNIRLVSRTARSITVQADPVQNSRGFEWRYWESGNERTARTRVGQRSITLTGLKASTAYKIQVRALKNVFTPDSVGDSPYSGSITATTTASGTDRAYPRMSASVSVREPNLTASFTFPGDSRVAPGSRTIITWSLTIGNVTKASGTLTNTTGPSSSGRSFTTRLSRSGITPPTYPYGDYKLNWAYTINGKSGPSGSANWLLPRRAGTSSIFSGTMTVNTRTRGNITEYGYSKGNFGAMSPAGGPINGIVVRSQRYGLFTITTIHIGISGSWTSVTVGGVKYNRSEGGNISYRGRVPTQNNATTDVVVR